MPRRSREKSESRIYHVIVRGINRQDIFQDEEDRGVYLDRLQRFKKECNFEIYAYCLMSNYVHLLLKENEADLATIMKKIGTSYAYWYNKKYGRIGHLFQDRYKSEAVENDKYLLTVVRYIHQNPVKVGLGIDYWTSYRDYFRSGGLTDSEYVLEILSSNNKKAQKEFKDFVNEPNEEQCLDLAEEKRVNDIEGKEIIERISQSRNIEELQTWENKKRNEVLRQIKAEGLTIRQIERLTGINRGVILKA